MNVLNVIAYCILAACAVGLLWCAFMQFRNNWVFNQRIRLIDEDLEAYEDLADYDTMMRRFWVWDVRKFQRQKRRSI